MGSKIVYKDKTKLLPSFIYKSYLLDRIFETYSLQNPILEIGCGTGEFFEKLKKNNLYGQSIDINEEIIIHCKNICKHLSLDLKIDKENIFDYNPKQVFNTIFMFEVLEHIQHDEIALNKVYNLLNEKGYLLMSVPGKQSLFSAEDVFQGHIRRYEKKELIYKLKKAGFKIKIFWCYNPFPYITRLLMKKDYNTGDVDIVTRTKNSSHAFFPTTKKLVDIFYPFYSKAQFLLKFQNLLLNYDFGAHYLVLLKK